jgi:prevent-host-death family protein
MNQTIGVAELKAHLSQHLQRVKRGEEVLVTEHGVPVARIVPVHVLRDTTLKRMAAEGILRLPTGKAGPLKPRALDPDGRLLGALLEEREAGF